MLYLSGTLLGMAQPVVTAPAADWARAGRVIRARRMQLGMSQDDLGTSKAVASALENGKQESFAQSTLLKVCRALGWTPDSIDRILDGGEPALLKDVWYPQDPTYGEPDASLDEKLADLNRRLTRVEQLVSQGDSDSDIPERYRRLLAELPPDEADALRAWWREHRGPPPAEQAS